MKTLSFRLNLITWITALLLLLIPVFSGIKTGIIIGQLVAVLIWMAVYYLFFLYLTPEMLLKKKLMQYAIVSVITIAVLPFFGYTILFLVKSILEGSFSDFYSAYSPAMHFSGLKAMFLAGVTGSFFRMIAEYLGEK